MRMGFLSFSLSETACDESSRPTCPVHCPAIRRYGPIPGHPTAVVRIAFLCENEVT